MRRIAGIFFLIGVWAVISYTGIVNPIFIAKPHLVIASISRLLIEKSFYLNLFYTLYRFATGIVASILIGVPVGLFLGFRKDLYSYTEIIFDFFRSLPATALFPLMILLFGIGDLSKIIVVVFSCSLINILNTYYGVATASRLRLDVLKVYQANNADIFGKLLFWEALPHIFSGIRVTTSLALVLVIVTEMFIGTEYGLGKSLIDAQTTYRIPELYAVIIIIGLIGYTLNRTVVVIQSKTLHWIK